jgi:hypothetical protein
LEFVKVGLGRGIGVVEWVGEGWVEGSEGEFVDYVAEIEGCTQSMLAMFKLNTLTEVNAYQNDPNAAQTPYIRDP